MKTLASVLHEVDPKLKVVSGSKTSRKVRATISELHEMAQPSVEERIRTTPAPRRLVRELDEEGNPGPPLSCPVCRREVDELFPYGYMGQRFACQECILRRGRLLEVRGRLVRAKHARGRATRARMQIIKYYAKRE